ncbi:unnamed protein product [Leptidea sinapis]|uniref:Uncharacterized protein n=1 Tax=Leptidea sinapis TaxID=189913 RepID=A0A5E4QW99_9NEOP|nr:unnamed protein product [Leptidea sinapis]
MRHHNVIPSELIINIKRPRCVTSRHVTVTRECPGGVADGGGVTAPPPARPSDTWNMHKHRSQSDISTMNTTLGQQQVTGIFVNIMEASYTDRIYTIVTKYKDEVNYKLLYVAFNSGARSSVNVRQVNWNGAGHWRRRTITDSFLYLPAIKMVAKMSSLCAVLFMIPNSSLVKVFFGTLSAVFSLQRQFKYGPKFNQSQI